MAPPSREVLCTLPCPAPNCDGKRDTHGKTVWYTGRQRIRERPIRGPVSIPGEVTEYEFACDACGHTGWTRGVPRE